MANSKKVKKVYVCPTCKGNGYLRFNLLLEKREFIEQCHDCDSQGELYDYGDDDFNFETQGMSVH